MERLGPYELLERLATGGMGATYLARRRGTAELRVLKLRHAASRNAAIMAARFAREGRVGAQLDHPNIAALVDASLEEGELSYLVFEHVAGPPLSQVLEAWSSSAPPPIEVVVHLALGILAGLHHLHELRDEDGALLFAVHRDVSPANVVLSADGIPKLIDLGLVRASGGDWRTESRVVVGTAQYVPPEIAMGDTKYADRRADVFSLGILLYEMLTARPMFPKGTSIASILPRLQRPDYPPVTHIRPEVPEELSAIISRALAIRPEDRWPHAVAFADALKRVGRAASDEEVAQALGGLLLRERQALEPLVERARADAAAELGDEPPIEPTRSSQPPSDVETLVVRSRREPNRGLVVDLRLRGEAPVGVSPEAAFNSSEMLRSVLPTRMVAAPASTSPRRAVGGVGLGFGLGGALVASVWWMSTLLDEAPVEPVAVVTASPRDASVFVVVTPVELTAMPQSSDAGPVRSARPRDEPLRDAAARRDAGGAHPAAASSEADALRRRLRGGASFQEVLDAAKVLATRRDAPAHLRAALDQAESTGDTDTLDRALAELE